MFHRRKCAVRAEPTNNWSVALQALVTSTYCWRAVTGHRTDLWSSVKADIIIGFLTYCGDNTFGRNAGFGHRVTCLHSGPQDKHCGLTDSACNSLTRRDVAMANKAADLRERCLTAAFVYGSNGAQERLLKTKFRSQPLLWDWVAVS